MGSGLSVDLGSSRTRVMTMAKSLVVDEPTIAAVEIGSGRLVRYGEQAAALRGRASGEVAIVRPVRHGQLQDLNLTDQICDHLLRRAREAGHSRPDVLCCVPAAATSVQRRALERSFKEAGAKRVEFLEHAVACGMGARLRIDEPVASMVVDVGAGTSDMAVIALGGVVTEASVALGGADFDDAIRLMCERSFDLVIDRDTAEAVKRSIGAAWPAVEEKVEVAGRDSSSGSPRAVVLSRSEVATAIGEHVDAVVRAAVGCITAAPPDLANDLIARGLHLAGCGGLLDGFSRRLASATGIPVHLVENPGLAAVTGASRCLKALSEL
jgi:rod shape-determining protein MreB